MVVGLVLCLGLSGLFLAQMKSAGLFTRTYVNPASVPLPQAGSTPALTKEYIYAGGRLVAVEEAGVPSGPGPTNLVATATAGTTVFLTWAAPTGTISNYQVERSQSINGPFTLLSPNPTATNFTDSTASAGVAYLYRVRAAYTGGGYSNYSNKDLATTIMFTDDPLTAGVTTVKALHVTELRQAVNAVRTTAALQGSTWTDASLTGVAAKGAHVQELRTNLDQALTALGIATSAYTDLSLPGITIKKVHIEELRARVK